jgi:predicted rRNA methylase YqxC with S4 and FtsJ domains
VKSYAIEAGFEIKNIAVSPITGKEGNTEYLIYLEKRE